MADVDSPGCEGQIVNPCPKADPPPPDHRRGFSQGKNGGSTGMPDPGDIGSSPVFGGSGGRLGTGIRIGSTVVSARDWAKVALGTALNTIKWGKADIVRFRATGGLHVINPQGTLLIRWQIAQVNWNLYGADDSGLSTEDVWSNFVDAMNARAGAGG